MSLFKSGRKKTYFSPPCGIDEISRDYEEELTRLRREVFILNKILREETDYEPPFIGPRRASMYGPALSHQMQLQRDRTIWSDLQDALMEQVINDLVFGPRSTQAQRDHTNAFYMPTKEPPAAVLDVAKKAIAEDGKEYVTFKVINNRNGQ